MQSILLVLALGFPIAVVLAWAFEVTPDGVKRTDTLAEGERPPSMSKSWDIHKLKALRKRSSPTPAIGKPIPGQGVDPIALMSKIPTLLVYVHSDLLD
jgi:hypothetical protein